MNRRPFFLWGCLGLFLVVAAGGVAINPFAEDQPVRFSTDADSESPTQGQQDLLNAAYGAPNADATGPARVPSDVDESTLWLARAIYSETKLPHEQELVAWVIRNRVETQYRSNRTYREVVLDPYQFSAFNPNSPKRSFYRSLDPELPLSMWQQALWIAYYVRHADPAYRPFSVETRHFFSERSMRGRRMPMWANQHQYVSPDWTYRVDQRRFRFYEEIS
ncbi:MAG: cell wall hydrolase [Salinibacter sp.]